MVVLQSISFANYALTTKTTNIIYGSAPYLTFDGGRTRVTNTEALLGISLSDGRTFTPTTTNSSDNPIELPVAGQSFNDIGMLVPRNTDSIALSSLIGAPYNYWGDDDGDGQGIDGITATGSLGLSIRDGDNNSVARNQVLDICKAPYRLTLSNTYGRLTTRYGVPNESRFNSGDATYYINPKVSSPAICYARPTLSVGGLSAAVWKNAYGFLPQSFTPSSYGLNFPTTGANNLYFDLDIRGTNQALSWATVSHGGITATMTNSTSTSVRVTLTGPAVTDPNKWRSDSPGRIAMPTLPQVFELVGRDSSGNAVVKYGFELKQWFVNRGNVKQLHPNMKSWCNGLGGYHLPKMKDLTNASCQRDNASACTGHKDEINALTATPSSGINITKRHIGTGFFSEWGEVGNYTGSNFRLYALYWTSDKSSFRNRNSFYIVRSSGSSNMVEDAWYFDINNFSGLCVYP
ncbi:hypothetical protein A9G16_05330 [Gilliamella apicola]|nr:hypothetical protein A9G16_05330 [Gilliamella apis]